MSIAAVIGNVLGGAVKPITKLGTKWVERKINKDTIKGKARMAKQEGATQITLTDSEWETAGKQAESGTFKDEYLTVVITSPLVLILAGSIVSAFTGDDRLTQGTIDGINALKALEVDLGELMTIVVLAGVALKVWRQ